jgi:hypothetical protein
MAMIETAFGQTHEHLHDGIAVLGLVALMEDMAAGQTAEPAPTEVSLDLVDVN